MQFLDSKSQGTSVGQDGHAYQEPSQYAQATPQNNMDDANKHNIAGGMNKPANHQAHTPTQTQGGSFPSMPTDDEIPFSPMCVV